MSEPIVPDTESDLAALHLDPAPYAVDTFTDLERGKTFTKLHFRRRNTSRAKALALIPEVLDDLARAGLTLHSALQVRLTGDNAATAPPTAKTKYDCYLEAPVHLLAQVQAEEAQFVAAMRDRYNKP